MGFFDAAKDFLNKTIEKEQNRRDDFQSRVNRAASKYANLSREELKQKYNSASDSVEKAAIMSIMKQNGWA